MLCARSFLRGPASRPRLTANATLSAAKSTAASRAESQDPKAKNASARKSKAAGKQKSSLITARGSSKANSTALATKAPDAPSVKKASVEMDEDAAPTDGIPRRQLRRAQQSNEALDQAENDALRLRKQMEDMADDMERERKPKKKPKNSAPLADRNASRLVPPASEVPEASALAAGQKYSTRNAIYQATVEEVLGLLEEEGAEDVVVLDVKKKCNWTSYFIVASGKSGKQVEGMTQFIVQKLKEKRQKLLYDMDDSSSDWIALDLGEIVVHLMVPQMRKKYDLEGLWMNRPELSPTEMFRQMLAPDPEDTDEKCLPEDGVDESLSPDETGLTPEEIKEVEELDDEEDLKRLLRAEREAADAMKQKKKSVK